MISYFLFHFLFLGVLFGDIQDFVGRGVEGGYLYGYERVDGGGIWPMVYRVHILYTWIINACSQILHVFLHYLLLMVIHTTHT